MFGTRSVVTLLFALVLGSGLCGCANTSPVLVAPEPPRASLDQLSEGGSNPTPTLSFDPSTSDALAKTVDRWHEAGLFDGSVLVSKEGRVWAGAAGFAVREFDVPNSRATRFPIASLTKQVTATLVMMQVEAGTLALDGTISDYLPWYREDTGAQITVRDLLSHTSGLPEMPASLAVEDGVEERGVQWLVTTYGMGDLLFEPGTAFAYANTEYQVLGAILEEVSGKRYEALLQDEVLTPLKMKNSGIARYDEVLALRAQDYVFSDGIAYRGPAFRWQNWHAAGAMYSTVDDLNLWNQALSNNTLVSAETFELMMTPRGDVGSTGNYVALGSWVYERALPGSDLAPTLIERRGAIGGYASLNVLVKGEPTWVVILTNSFNEQIHQLPWGRSLPLDLLMILNG